MDRLNAAMATGEIRRGNPELLSWILMGIGEIVGMRWILWGETDHMPDDIFEETMRFIRRGLGAHEPS